MSSRARNQLRHGRDVRDTARQPLLQGVTMAGLMITRKPRVDDGRDVDSQDQQHGLVRDVDHVREHESRQETEDAVAPDDRERRAPASTQRVEAASRRSRDSGRPRRSAARRRRRARARRRAGDTPTTGPRTRPRLLATRTDGIRGRLAAPGGRDRPPAPGSSPAEAPDRAHPADRDQAEPASIAGGGEHQSIERERLEARDHHRPAADAVRQVAGEYPVAAARAGAHEQCHEDA